MLDTKLLHRGERNRLILLICLYVFYVFHLQLRPVIGTDGTHNFVLMNRRMNNIISDGFIVDSARNSVTFNSFEGIQRERESLFFQLPPKFRGDQVAAYGGTLRFTLEYTGNQAEGRPYRDVDVEIIVSLHSCLYFKPIYFKSNTCTYYKETQR